MPMDTKWFTTAGGERMAYHETGSGDPALIFVHGVYGSRGGFGLQEEYFSPNHRCLAVDLIGNTGESDQPDRYISMAEHADHVTELIRHLGLHKPVLIGQSMGGQVVISAAARHPDLVGAVASLDSPSNAPGWTKNYIDPFNHLMVHGGPLREALLTFIGAAYLSTDPDHAGSFMERMAPIPDFVLVNGWQTMTRFDPVPVLPKVKSPYLYIDCGQPGVDFAWLRELCPQVVIGKTVGSGHKALQDVPDQVNAMLRRFIEHADDLAEEMIRTGGVFQYTFPTTDS